ncbi:hypothetical protein NQZ68_013595 [Dissostichus eleginoides]|nr:hypothetical protein NQZ68_013595 [Dissostichus eleginoides]
MDIAKVTVCNHCYSWVGLPNQFNWRHLGTELLRHKSCSKSGPFPQGSSPSGASASGASSWSVDYWSGS